MSGAAVLVFGRCAGFVFRAPGFSHPVVPHAVRAGVALVLAIGLAPVVRASRVPDGVAFVLALATEFGIGAAIGLAASLLYDGAYAGGRALDDYVGIRGSVPTAQLYAPSGFGRIWSNVFLAGFFLCGGYRPVVLVFARSFDRLRPGAVTSAAGFAHFATALPGTIIGAALLVAAPAIALAFVMQFTLAALARVIPRFASFTLSFPLVFLAGLAATLVAVPLLFPQSGHPWLYLPFLGPP
ncbi:MAG TPA: flagellar biosynthetic protein FliR [Candidatus Baltobacteraceae bacterium]|jgi:flagellar biosynthesis protein FliR